MAVTTKLYGKSFAFGSIMEIRFGNTFIDGTVGITSCASINGLGSLT